MHLFWTVSNLPMKENICTGHSAIFPADSLMDMPMLFSFPDSIYMAITEAALLDYAGMYSD